MTRQGSEIELIYRRLEVYVDNMWKIKTIFETSKWHLNGNETIAERMRWEGKKTERKTNPLTLENLFLSHIMKDFYCHSIVNMRTPAIMSMTMCKIDSC